MPTQRSPYAFEVWRPLPYDPGEPGKAERIADISSLCLRREFSIRRTRGEELSLTLDLQAAEAFAVERFGRDGFATLFDEGRNEIRVRRDQRYLFGVQIGPTIQDIGSGSESFQLAGTNWLSMLGHRFHTTTDPLSFTDVDISDLIMDLIAAAQDGEQGNILLTEGTLTSSRPATAVFKPYGATMQNMVQEVTDWADSVDISVDHERKVHTYYPSQGVDRTDLHFRLGPGGNIAHVRMTTDPNQIVNDSVNRSSGNGLEVTTIETVPNEGSRNYYGQRTRIDDFPAVTAGATDRLQASGAETVRTYGRPLSIPDIILDDTVPPFLGSYWVGDWVSFDLRTRPSLARVSDRPWRINEIGVTIDANDHTEVRLALGMS